MATYVNNLRLKEIATGDESGTWGTSTNTNLELVGEALGYGTEALTTNADTQTITMADGAADEVRALYLKITGALDSNCTITLAPNTVKKVWIIENATTDSGSSGPYSIIISQGSGANVTIGNSKVSVIYTDGAGGSAAVVDALTDLVVTDSLQVAGPTLTVGDAAAEDTKLLFDGNAKDFYIGLDDGTDTLVVGEGSTVGTNPILTLTDDSVTIGDGAAVDTKIVYDGNAQDFYIGLDDSADDLVIGLGSTVGTTPAVTIDEDQKVVFPAAHVTVGDGTAEDTALIYNGNAQDYYIGLDDSADDLIIGLGSSVGTTPIISMDEDQHISLQATKRLYLDGFGNTYIRESAADVISLTTGGTDRWKIDASGHLLSVADDNYDLGAAGASRPRDVFFGTSLSIGDNPAGSGTLRLQKNFGIFTRNNANDANKVVISENTITGNDTLDIGDNGKWSAMRFHVSTANVMELTATAINLNKAVTMNNAAIKMTGLATSDPGVAGQLWNDSNDVKISAG